VNSEKKLRLTKIQYVNDSHHFLLFLKSSEIWAHVARVMHNFASRFFILTHFVSFLFRLSILRRWSQRAKLEAIWLFVRINVIDKIWIFDLPVQPFTWVVREIRGATCCHRFCPAPGMLGVPTKWQSTWHERR